MKNISLDKEPIELLPNIKYIVIDAMYINEIRLEISNLINEDILNAIRSNVFPYTDTPFAEYTPEERVFTLDKIKKVDYDQIDPKERNAFSTDSGAIVFVNERVFVDFTSKFDYNELVDSSTELLNVAYWGSIVNNFDLSDIAIIISPGINSGVEFDGSGTYKIE
ncbi:hypothetical protein M1D52_21920 [Olivibacter sp. SA151]|uniref:hypothetical protein n=1 Tax=Olivibacter jilunii TaxID=985016 RepID=UPI003F19099E